MVWDVLYLNVLLYRPALASAEYSTPLFVFVSEVCALICLPMNLNSSTKYYEVGHCKVVCSSSRIIKTVLQDEC